MVYLRVLCEGYRHRQAPSYGASRKVIIPTSKHCPEHHVNNRAEVLYEHMRFQEGGKLRFKSPGPRVRFLGALGNGRVNMQIYVGFSDIVHPDPVETELPTILDFPAPKILWL